MSSFRQPSSPAPPLTPISPSSIPRPQSVTSTHRPRLSSDHSLPRGSPEPDVRNVRVVLRVRPNDPDDASVPPRFRNVLVHPTTPTEVRVDVDPATLIGAGASSAAGSSKRHPTFSFDSVLGESSSQMDLYDATSKDTVDEFLKGHNTTFFAYGQTSSGKSYSMGTTGEDADYTGTEFNARTGLIPRTVQTIFEKAEQIRIASGPGATWECRLSFLELYNEEIIDLLSGSGLAISIREERDGRIVWSGVREVRVRTLAEVMQYLYEGSARRKTGETGMNATSSRSHAIFSLTMVQKRRSNASLPGSMMQPLGEVSTPTRQLKRPTSMIGMAAARSPTPSGSRSNIPPSAFAKGSSLPRPTSFMGPSPSDAEYIIVTSKFNMVDLAGSERLKRTAAQGDRMKEGISINSGLLALGNVISTLADPVKARGHIPYRDSKLTRMLQDSIGGNALTTMIACVSPVEYNINETVNTIKYASRARNIKNAAKINAVEAGWDDVEHLQSLVTKLRKQVASIEADGGMKTPQKRSDDVGSEKLLQRLAELQREHTELYDRYLGKCSENMRLTSELKSSKPGDGDALAKFNETVEPVILEYEKVVGALNKQLDELRAELTNISDLYEDQNRQLLDAQSQQTANEIYVNELRSRLTKLSERNISSETYIQDLESKLKSHADTADTQGDNMAGLRGEIAKLKESNTRLAQHTSEIEARLAKSEEHSSSLLAQIEQHEKEAADRKQAYKDLQSHLAVLDTSNDNKLLLEELTAKDERISLLERQLIEQQDTQTERNSLLLTVEAERAAQNELRAKLETLQASVSTTGSGRDTSRASFNDAKETLAKRAVTPPDSSGSIAAALPQNEHIAQLEAALQELSAKFADAESKYTEAEHYIAELTAQLSEAKLIHAELDDVVPTTEAENENGDSDSSTSITQTPSIPNATNSPTKSSRRGSASAPASSGVIAVKQKDFRVGRGFGESQRARPQSLSQELSSARLLDSPRASWTGPNALRLATSPSRQSLPAMQKTLRSSQSLEAELRFVHEVVTKRDEELKDREAYIRQLEETIRQQSSHLTPSLQPSAQSLRSIATPCETDQSILIPANIPLPPSPTFPRVEIRADEQVDSSMIDLSPSSTQRFNDLKRSLALLGDENTPDADAQVCVDVLLREMAVKESSQRGVIEQQFVQIADLQKANNKLKEELSQMETSGPSSSSPEIAAVPFTPVKSSSRPILPRSPSHSSLLSQQTLPSPTPAMNRLREEHAEEVQALLKGQAESLEVLQREHAENMAAQKAAMADLQVEHQTEIVAEKEAHEKAIFDLAASHSAALTSLQQQHDPALRDMTECYKLDLADLEQRHVAALEALGKEQEVLVEEMEKQLSSSEEQRRQLKMKADQAAFEISKVRDETAIQRNVMSRQLVEMQKTTAELGRVKEELEMENKELLRRISEQDAKIIRKNSPMPPQGPPPNTPLPPLPSQLASPMIKDPSSDGSQSWSTHRSTESSGSTAPTTAHDVGVAVANLPEPIGQMVQKVLAERDAALAAKQQMLADLEKIKETDAKLAEERSKAEAITRDLHDARKTNSKLRAHLEDSRQESKRLTEACREHMTELNDRRNTMATLSKETGQQRDSLLAATAQVAALKAQLDRAVEQKVNKKLNNRLKPNNEDAVLLV